MLDNYGHSILDVYDHSVLAIALARWLIIMNHSVLDIYNHSVLAHQAIFCKSMLEIQKPVGNLKRREWLYTAFCKCCWGKNESKKKIYLVRQYCNFHFIGNFEYSVPCTKSFKIFLKKSSFLVKVRVVSSPATFSIIQSEQIHNHLSILFPVTFRVLSISKYKCLHSYT